MTWVCGSERVLVEQVVDHVRKHLDVADIDYISMVGGVDKDRDIWAAANQYPTDPTAKRLVLVRNAEKITRWKPLEGWIAASRTIPTLHLLFVSEEHDFPYVKTPEGKNVELKTHAEAIKNRGRIIRCSPPAEEDQYTWLKQFGNLSDDTAKYLLTRVAGDLVAAKGAVLKASMFQGEITPSVVDVMVLPEPGDAFVLELLALRKDRAINSVVGVAEKDISKTIGILDSRLEVLGKLHRLQRERKTAKDIIVSGAVNQFLVRMLIPYASTYDQSKRLHCRRVLAAADDAYRSGARTGILETVTALW